MEKYTVEETNEYAVVEFNDNEALEFFKDFKSAFDFRARKLNTFDTIDCVGEDNHIYFISSNGVEKQNITNDFSLKKLKKIKTKTYYLCRKVEAYYEKLLSENTTTTSISNVAL